MANIKQQIKRNRTNEKSRLLNSSFKSSVRTVINDLKSAVENGDKELATKKLPLAFKKLDKGLAKGLYHKNFVARNKSHLTKLVNSL